MPDIILPMRVLALITDGFGNNGGIAQHARNLLTAMSGFDFLDQVDTFPRVCPASAAVVPEKVRLHSGGCNTRVRYLLSVAKQAMKSPRPGLIVCTHINLLPAATLASRVSGAPVIQILHGIECWQPRNALQSAVFTGRVGQYVAVSEFTRGQFLGWSGVDPEKCAVIPNALVPGQFSPGPKPGFLLERHGIGTEKVILTLGRLSALEQGKGFDRVIQALPSLLAKTRDLKYVIAGDGDDRKRLSSLAQSLGVESAVIFAGHVPESEKADYYRLADCYAMPSKLEGFGIVYLEAMACGIPVVGSRVDGSTEALANGELGELVDPDSPREIAEGIRRALNREKTVPPGIQRFDSDRIADQYRQMFVSQIAS